MLPTSPVLAKSKASSESSFAAATPGLRSGEASGLAFLGDRGIGMISLWGFFRFSVGLAFVISSLVFKVSTSRRKSTA